MVLWKAFLANTRVLRLTYHSELVQVLHNRHHCAVITLYLWIGRVDQVKLVWRVSSAPKPKPEMSGRQTQWISGENISRPRSRQARPHYRIYSATLVHCYLCTNQRRVCRRARRIVSTGHVHFYVPETAFCQMSFESRQRLCGSHIGDESQIELRHRFVWKYGLAAGSGIPTDQSFNVHRRFRNQQLKRVAKSHIAYKMVDSELFLSGCLVHPSRCLGDHRLLGIRKRPRFGTESFNCRFVTIRCDQSRKSLDQMPCGTIKVSLGAGVNILARAAAPLFAARYELELDDPFRT